MINFPDYFWGVINPEDFYINVNTTNCFKEWQLENDTHLTAKYAQPNEWPVLATFHFLKNKVEYNTPIFKYIYRWTKFDFKEIYLSNGIEKFYYNIGRWDVWHPKISEIINIFDLYEGLSYTTVMDVITNDSIITTIYYKNGIIVELRLSNFKNSEKAYRAIRLFEYNRCKPDYISLFGKDIAELMIRIHQEEDLTINFIYKNCACNLLINKNKYNLSNEDKEFIVDLIKKILRVIDSSTRAM